MGELKERVPELLRRTKITSKTRFQASERLGRHDRLSRWTISLLTCALIYIPLVEHFGGSGLFSEDFVTLLQIFLAVLILAYSLHLGQESFSLRADQMHRNGVELGKFARKLAGITSQEVDDECYQVLLDEYYEILEKYENHKRVDYYFASLAQEADGLGEKFHKFFKGLKAYLITLVILSHYFVSVAVAGFICYSISPNPLA